LSSELRLTPISYIVLGLLENAGESTPYDLKRAAALGLGDLWSLQHAQLYSEPARLAGAGLVTERRELTGRRRRHFMITDAGRGALRAWLEQPTDAFTELRDPGLLKLFFGAPPGPLAAVQLSLHERKLANYEQLRAAMAERVVSGPALALESGIGHEREWVRFWRALTDAAGR